jgi:hypothetical protein
MAKLPLRTFNTLKADYIRGGTFSAATMIVGAEGMIRSSNYAAGSAGWMIDGDGNAEFNNVTVRGTIYATAGEISGTLTVATGGKIVMPLSAGFEMVIEAGGISMNTTPILSTKASMTLDSGGNLLFTGDGGMNEADFLDFPSGIYIGPSANAVPQPIGLVIEHNGVPYDPANTSILVRTDKYGTPGVLFEVNGNGRVHFHDGSAALPSIAFESDPNTGIYRSAVDHLAISAGGTITGVFNSTGFYPWTGRIKWGTYGNYDGDPAAGASIQNDSGTYKALMILGNRSYDGSNRLIKMYDRLSVEGYANATRWYVGNWPASFTYSYFQENYGWNYIEGISQQQPFRITTGAFILGNFGYGNAFTSGLMFSAPPTGSGNAANWVTTGLAGVYYLTRNTSSERFKRNVKKWDGSLGSVLDLTPVYYEIARGKQVREDDKEWDGEYEMEWLGEHHLGITAEDVAENFPVAATRDAFGRPDSYITEEIVAGLLYEVKTLRARVDTLEQRLAGRP